jgi:hypothetical protein
VQLDLSSKYFSSGILVGTLTYTKRGVNRYRTGLLFLQYLSICYFTSYEQLMIKINIHTIHNTQRFHVETQMGENQKTIML